MKKLIVLCFFASLEIFAGKFPLLVGPRLTEEDRFHLVAPFKHITELIKLESSPPKQQALIKKNMAPLSNAEALLEQLIICYESLYQDQRIKNGVYGIPDLFGNPVSLLDYTIPATILYEEGSLFIRNHSLVLDGAFNPSKNVYEKTYTIEGREISFQKSFKVFQKIMNAFFSNLKLSDIPITHPYGVLDIRFPRAPHKRLGYLWDEGGVVPVTIEEGTPNFTSMHYSELCGLTVFANHSQIIPEPHAYIYKSRLIQGMIRVDFTSDLTHPSLTTLSKKSYDSLSPLSMPHPDASLSGNMRITPESQRFLKNLLGDLPQVTFPLPQTAEEEELFLLNLLEESLDEGGLTLQDSIQALTHSLAALTLESSEDETTEVLSPEAQKERLREEVQKRRQALAKIIVENASPKEDMLKKAQASHQKKQRAQKAKKKKRLTRKEKMKAQLAAAVSATASTATTSAEAPQDPDPAISGILADFEKKRLKWRDLSRLVKSVCKDNVDLKKSLVERFAQIRQSGSHRSLKGATVVAPHGAGDRTVPGRYFTDFIRTALEGTEASPQASQGADTSLEDAAC